MKVNYDKCYMSSENPILCYGTRPPKKSEDLTGEVKKEKTIKKEKR